MEHAIATDGRGTIYVSNSEQHRVQVHAADGAFTQPSDIAITNDHVYVVDAGERRVKRFPSPARRVTPC